MKKFEKGEIPTNKSLENFKKLLAKNHYKKNLSVEETIDAIARSFHKRLVNWVNSYNELVDEYEKLQENIENIENIEKS